LEEAVEKLKRGETIGPTTKAATEKEEEESSGKASTEEGKLKEVADADGNEQKGQEETEGSSEEVADTVTDSGAATVIETPPGEDEKDIPSTKAAQKPYESEDSSDSHSTDSDIPPTPAFSDIQTSNPDLQAEFAEANIRETQELRSTAFKAEIAPQVSQSLVTSIDAALSETPQTAEPLQKDETHDTSSQTPDKPVEPVEAEQIEVVHPDTSDDVKTMEGWEMLEMVLRWVCKEFSADEEALARQIANKEISFRFLWLYYVPGSLISLQDPISKQQMAARVSCLVYKSYCRLKPLNMCLQILALLLHQNLRFAEKSSIQTEMTSSTRIYWPMSTSTMLRN
jgi:hypothetical protein